jgi:hypothetical protein
LADFQSSKTAAEIEEVLVGALTYKSPQALTESEKAFVRAKIGATELGEGIKIVSHFDSLEELEAAVPKPKAGDAYSIGTELPYNLYVYDFAHATWVNHGAIRANDIEARFAQNKAVAVGAWEEDTDVFVDYTYKAAIPLAEVTGNDFPIVAFSPADAAGGNFCPICFAFDGYVEIWANAIPTADLVIPAITFIVEDTEDGETGNSTKGITNATGVIKVGENLLLDGSITANKVKNEARTQYFDVAVGIEWTGEAAPYNQTIAVEGLLETDRAVVRFSAPNSFENLDAQQEAFAMLYTAESADGAITLYAKEKPETAFSVVLEVARI